MRWPAASSPRSEASEPPLTNLFQFAAEHLTPRALQISYLWLVANHGGNNRGAATMSIFNDEYLSNFLHAALAIPFAIPLVGMTLRILSHLV